MDYHTITAEDVEKLRARHQQELDKHLTSLIGRTLRQGDNIQFVVNTNYGPTPEKCGVLLDATGDRCHLERGHAGQHVAIVKWDYSNMVQTENLEDIINGSRPHVVTDQPR